MTDRVKKVESENVELHNRISECEKITSRTDNLSEKISELEAKLEYNELRDRKYNILIYGLPEKTQPQNENTEELVREFVCNSVRLGKHYSDNIAICNTHRLPRKNRNAADAVANGPPAIIVKLATMRTRDGDCPLVLRPIGPTTHWSYGPLVLRPIGNMARKSYCSDIGV